ncbi:uncharacterized protein EDB91DRAFT_1078238 [Suillus paluster]|uniref:uncharacterized protein n=1 Tax=Suillus paluster TaxID=48578 RepID=UPI001B85BEC3|nr:uncharacterized protein EDB91DRAFT_1078238 [Suillus paluster]KAG1751455.1 hypothetical protein EDB91DRAFT_1078238 [Suillus paluster]
MSAFEGVACCPNRAYTFAASEGGPVFQAQSQKSDSLERASISASRLHHVERTLLGVGWEIQNSRLGAWSATQTVILGASAAVANVYGTLGETVFEPTSYQLQANLSFDRGRGWEALHGFKSDESLMFDPVPRHDAQFCDMSEDCAILTFATGQIQGKDAPPQVLQTFASYPQMSIHHLVAFTSISTDVVLLVARQCSYYPGSCHTILSVTLLEETTPSSFIPEDPTVPEFPGPRSVLGSEGNDSGDNENDLKGNDILCDQLRTKLA